LPYSDRVVGIGDFKAAPVPKPFLGSETMATIWQDANRPGGDRPANGENAQVEPNTGVSVGSNYPVMLGEADGASTGVERPARAIPAFAAESNTANTAPGSDAELTASTEDTDGRVPSAKKHLLIETNEDVLTYGSTETANSEPNVQFQLPATFKPELNLHPHQEQGVIWLRTCFETHGRRGVLMADDMGLGKTIQILTFLASCIEGGLFPDLSQSAPPFRPILVVVPLILLETKTWEREMERFFENDGAIFWPVLPLHGAKVNQFRRDHVYRAELELGQPVLDLNKIARHRVVITNYETVRSYQHSFAYCPNWKSMWSVVVSDEAQEYKVPGSRISHAMKAIKADFQIACTGTPIENRLLGLWNLFDSVQPGLLSSAREFVSNFESRVQSTSRDEMLAELKQRLLFQQPNAYLLRRNKSEVADLPQKHVRKVLCIMSQREIDLHEQLLRELKEGTSPTRFLAALHRFAQLSQHPSLLSGDGEDQDVGDLGTR
jgi:SNF2 family DNA or RNA helicase